MVGSFPGCCADAASGHASVVPPRSVMNSRRFMQPIRVSSLPDHGTPIQDGTVSRRNLSVCDLIHLKKTNGQCYPTLHDVAFGIIDRSTQAEPIPSAFPNDPKCVAFSVSSRPGQQ